MNKNIKHEMEGTRPLQFFEGKAIVGIDTGKKIGMVEDILIDPNSMAIKGIVTARGGLFRPGFSAIMVEEVFLWGEDAVLVKHSDSIHQKDELQGMDPYVSAFEHVGGRDVISTTGERVGEMEDVLITRQGELAGFEVSHIRNGLAEMIEEHRSDGYHLPVSTVQSFGKDVLIIDLNKVKNMIMAAPPVEEGADYNPPARAEDRPVVDERPVSDVRTPQARFVPVTGEDLDRHEVDEHRVEDHLRSERADHTVVDHLVDDHIVDDHLDDRHHREGQVHSDQEHVEGRYRRADDSLIDDPLVDDLDRDDHPSDRRDRI